jgi:hypothetical protein
MSTKPVPICENCSRLSSENSFYSEKIEQLRILNEQLRAENYKLRLQAAPKPMLAPSIFSSVASFIKSPAKLFAASRFKVHHFCSLFYVFEVRIPQASRLESR